MPMFTCLKCGVVREKEILNDLICDECSQKSQNSLSMKDKCSKWLKTGIPCMDCDKHGPFDCYDEKEFNCRHFDGSGCMCMGEGSLHSECGENVDCVDYSEE